MPLDEIRVSYGTAILLGLVSARQDIPPTTAYLLWDPGCVGSCSFCSRSGQRKHEEKLSRVIWPVFPFSEVVSRLTEKKSLFKRICLQTGWNPDFEEKLKSCTKALLPVNLPLCVTLHPSQTRLAKELLALGASRIGIGLDAASQHTYETHKNRRWQPDWDSLVSLLERRKGRIEVHLIFGLGDSEETFINTADTIINKGGAIALFALTKNGAGGAPAIEPDLSAYRRIQVFCHLRQLGKLTMSQCRFCEGKLAGLRIPTGDLRESLNGGDAFRTSGCDDCNRPFYNERPGRKMYNFPRQLNQEEAFKAFLEANLEAE